MALEIVKPGALTSIQDAGRHGYLNTGLSPAGPLDNLSLRIASLLVGNDVPSPMFSKGSRGDAGLEITFMGPAIKFTEDSLIAITGGTFNAKLDGEVIPSYESVAVKAGQTLDFGMVVKGARAYLAIAGGVDVEPVLGSRAENLFASRGPLGRALKAGDVLPTVKGAAAQSHRKAGVKFDESVLPVREKKSTLRVVMGPQDDLFTDESIEDFKNEEWTLSQLANRMGLRFRGPVLKFKDRPEYLSRDAGSDPSNIVDDVIPIGGIQCPSGIEAIVMGTENPTVGGFAKIATVISADIGAVAQMKPGQKAQFVPVTSMEAIEVAKQEAALVTPENLISGA